MRFSGRTQAFQGGHGGNSEPRHKSLFPKGFLHCILRLQYTLTARFRCSLFYLAYTIAALPGS